MNGVSLLVAVTLLGVDVGWENTPQGPAYTVHLEKLLLESLREGQMVVSAVGKDNRGLTRFQIVMGDTSRPAGPPDPADKVQHGWQPSEEGTGSDYVIQISPERLETLAAGKPILGEIDRSVTDIRHLLIFVGTRELPREVGPSAGSGALEPPEFRQDTGLQRASAQVENSSGNSSGSSPGVGTPQFNGTQFQGSGPRSGDNRGDSSTNANPGAVFVGNQGEWQHAGSGGTQEPGSGYQHAGRSDGQSGGQPFSGRQDFGNRNTTLPVPQLTGQRGGYNTAPSNAYRPTGNEGYSGQTPPQQQFPQTQAPPQGGFAQPGFAASPTGYPGWQQQTYPAQAPPQATVAMQQSAPAATPAATPQASPAPAANPSPAPQVETKKAEPPESSSMPLILTTLMLFTSIGINAFLGWLAWSFFWRYRDAAGDMARARASSFAKRQAA